LLSILVELFESDHRPRAAAPPRGGGRARSCARGRVIFSRELSVQRKAAERLASSATARQQAQDDALGEMNRSARLQLGEGGPFSCRIEG
jgi:hypothetical protein